MATVDRERQLERARGARRHPQSVDARRRQLRRNHDAPVRERNPCRLLTGRLPAERPAPTADRERQHRRRRRLLPARKRGRGCGVRHRALGCRVSAHFTAASSGGGGNQPPVAVAGGSPTSGTIPLSVAFSSAGSSDPDGTIASYAWDLDGDGAYDDSSAANPSFQYTVAGSYSVRLRVTDNQGASDDSDPVTITAQPGGNQPPVAVAGGSPTSGTIPLSVAFSSAARAIPTAPSRPTPGISTATAPSTTRASRTRPSPTPQRGRTRCACR